MTTIKKTSKDPRQSLEGAVLFWLQQSQQRLRQAILAGFRAHGIELSAAQWDLLMALWQCDGVSQSTLAGVTGRDKAGITRLLDGMVERGWVERRRPPGNRRRYAVHLTQAGRQLHERLLPIAQTVAEQALEGLNERDKTGLRNGLKRIHANLRAP